MIYRLVILSGPLHGQCFTVETAPMTIGHGPDCSIALPDSEVAGQHAVVEHTDEGLSIRDLGSMNRIVVNRREVKTAKLHHGDVIEVGRTRLLVRALVQAEVEGREANETPDTSRLRRMALPWP